MWVCWIFWPENSNRKPPIRYGLCELVLSDPISLTWCFTATHQHFPQLVCSLICLSESLLFVLCYLFFWFRMRNDCIPLIMRSPKSTLLLHFGCVFRSIGMGVGRTPQAKSVCLRRSHQEHQILNNFLIFQIAHRPINIDLRDLFVKKSSSFWRLSRLSFDLLAPLFPFSLLSFRASPPYTCLSETWWSWNSWVFCKICFDYLRRCYRTLLVSIIFN